MNELKYPIVAKMDKDVLTIPITTVSSKSAFSTGGRVVNDYRSSLFPWTVQDLVCASSWIRGGHHKPPPQTEGFGKYMDVAAFLPNNCIHLILVYFLFFLLIPFLCHQPKLQKPFRLWVAISYYVFFIMHASSLDPPWKKWIHIASDL